MKEDQIKFTKEKKENAQMFRLSGKIDAFTVRVIETEILESINPANKNLLIDFENVSYLSSAGIKLLFTAAKKARQFSGKFILFNVSTKIMEIIHISQLNHFLGIAYKEEDALNDLE